MIKEAEHKSNEEIIKRRTDQFNSSNSLLSPNDNMKTQADLNVDEGNGGEVTGIFAAVKRGSTIRIKKMEDTLRSKGLISLDEQERSSSDENQDSDDN